MDLASTHVGDASRSKRDTATAGWIHASRSKWPSGVRLDPIPVKNWKSTRLSKPHSLTPEYDFSLEKSGLEESYIIVGCTPRYTYLQILMGIVADLTIPLVDKAQDDDKYPGQIDPSAQGLCAIPVKTAQKGNFESRSNWPEWPSFVSDHH
ncbi:hypothetical protein OE88DRAFT_1649084 [Heliocybe sulcata]|uniref:Uncharacterized protein n=1 Tax=Heliocybe sulcata TaxID=5364 RepID=A0A5C3MKE4_9AGAM|nr:hypothetical protein OE88DRAFT_1649084 [Heliocybe sulcata]